MAWLVYKHTSPSGKVYIGITSKSPEVRWQKGGTGYRNCPYFWRAIRKYGWENIQHEIVMSNLSEEEADNLEEYLVATLKSNLKPYGYNISKGGDGTRKGLHNSAEQNRKISDSHKKRVCCYNRDGEKVATFESVNAAADFVEGSFRVVSACCNGTKKSGYGYVWRFEGDAFDKYSIENKVGGVKGTPVVVHTLDGELIGIFKTAKLASQVLGVNATTISQICKQVRSQCNGFVFDYYTQEGSDEGNQSI